MNSRLTVSVIIPTYNRENILPRAVESVINQSYKNWELFIVDDGSTDNTKQLIQQKYADNPRIKFVKRPSTRPKGANVCRNIGIEKAKGRYVALLDSDDEWTPQHLEYCLQLAENKEDFYGCYSGAVIQRGKYGFRRKSRRINPHENYFDFLLEGGFAQTSSFFLDRKAALYVKFDENLHRHQDWDFFIRFGEKYSWSYNDSIEVVIHWDMDTTHKKIDFDSCINFYRNYGHRIQKERNKEKYLYSMYKKALMKKADIAANYYRSEIKRNNFARNNLSIQYPCLYKNYELLKSKLKINRVKNIAKFYWNKLQAKRL